MASSQVAIYNMAIGMVGGTRAMSTADSHDEVTLLNELWPTAVDDVVASRDWSFARTVALLAPTPDPLGLDRATFAIPGDAATIRQVGDDSTCDNELEWTIENGIILVTRVSPGLAGPSSGSGPTVAWGRYTKQTREVGLFDGPFVAALVARLAFELALPIAQSRPMFEALSALYVARLKMADTTDGMQGKHVPFTRGKLSRAHNQ